MAVKDLMGQRFGILTVIQRLANMKDGTALWLCRCDCGEIRHIPGTGLRAGRNQSCGCGSPRFTSERVRTHGMSGTPTYRVWAGMMGRCSDAAKGKTRRLYWDKGIRVCERWHSFENFLADMGERPDGMTIERNDGYEGYAPWNCVWATSKVQGRNTTANHIVEHQGMRKTVSEWAEDLGIKPNTLTYRLRRGMPPERALSKTLRKFL